MFKGMWKCSVNEEQRKGETSYGNYMLTICLVYSTIVLGQAQTYSSDLKMAHYVRSNLIITCPQEANTFCLDENSAQDHFLVSSYCKYLGSLCTDCHHELDPGQYS
jgi:hypothetical protein